MKDISEVWCIISDMARAFSNNSVEAGAFDVSFVPESRLSAAIQAQAGFPVAAIRYGQTDAPPFPIPCPRLEIPMPQPAGNDLVELWTSPVPVMQSSHGQVVYVTNGQSLFGAFEADEPAGASVEALSENAYAQIFDAIRKAGYPHLIRLWNYVHDINGEQDGLERYRRFCVGRHAAYAKRFREFEHNLPAGSCVGTQKPSLIVYFVAARATGTPVQNPRQVDAFRYPSLYGPRSPLFSRAMVKDWGTHCDLFTSGTASIVSHESRHIGDAHGQLAETLRNLRALLARAEQVTSGSFRAGSADALYKLYLRNEENYAVIQRLLSAELEDEAPVLYLIGPLCRSELLLEIEGMFRAGTGQPVRAGPGRAL